MSVYPSTRHVWIGRLAVAWFVFTSMDFALTVLNFDPYVSMMTIEQSLFFYTLPRWVLSVWGGATFVGLFGAVLLLQGAGYSELVLGLSTILMGTAAVFMAVGHDPDFYTVAGVGGLALLVFFVLVCGAFWGYARGR